MTQQSKEKLREFILKQRFRIQQEYLKLLIKHSQSLTIHLLKLQELSLKYQQDDFDQALEELRLEQLEMVKAARCITYVIKLRRNKAS